MSDEDLRAELERLRSKNAALKKGGSTNICMQVSEKGAVSVYGMGRYPVTLYKELTLLDLSDEIRAFIAANEAQLKAKEKVGWCQDGPMLSLTAQTILAQSPLQILVLLRSRRALPVHENM